VPAYFELTLPPGSGSMLGAVEDVCRGALQMPYTPIDQSGAQVTGSTHVAVSGCRKSVIKRAEMLDRSERHARDDVRSAHA
jgi:hypothetical protein